MLSICYWSFFCITIYFSLISPLSLLFVSLFVCLHLYSYFSPFLSSPFSFFFICFLYSCSYIFFKNLLYLFFFSFRFILLLSLLPPLSTSKCPPSIPSPRPSSSIPPPPPPPPPSVVATPQPWADTQACESYVSWQPLATTTYIIVIDSFLLYITQHSRTQHSKAWNRPSQNSIWSRKITKLMSTECNIAKLKLLNKSTAKF